MLTVERLKERAFENAGKKGFYDDFNRIAEIIMKHGTKEDAEFFKQIWLGYRLMLVTSELAEGLEAVRDRNYSCEPKSGGLGEEIADAQIRLADLFGHAIPARTNEDVLELKLGFNESRPYKHGRSL